MDLKDLIVGVFITVSASVLVFCPPTILAMDLGEWLDTYNPRVISYLENLSDDHVGRSLDGVAIDDDRDAVIDENRMELEGAIYLGKTLAFSKGAHIYLFNIKNKTIAYVWVDEDGKPLPASDCKDNLGPPLVRVLSGDVYTWRDLQPGHGLVIVSCPSQEWIEAVKQGKSFEKGTDAYNQGNYTEAIRLWRPLAEQGHVEAQYNLGAMFSDGDVVGQDYAEAAYWFRKAAELGHADAQYSLGFMHWEGYWVVQDSVKALMWANLAATKGIENAIKIKAVISEELTPSQVEEAQRMADDWLLKHNQ